VEEFLREYFTDNFTRPIEGAYSWEHLLQVTIVAIIAITLGIYFGKKHDSRFKALKIAAIIMLGVESTKYIQAFIIKGNFSWIEYSLPLFLCSIQLLTVPLAAYTKGRFQKIMLDFVVIFGWLGAFLGTYFAANIYSYVPVIHFRTINSLITHALAGFATVYIIKSKSTSLEKKNIPYTLTILLVFVFLALLANKIYPSQNYMFLNRSDGTPFYILENIVQGKLFSYRLLVILSMSAYMLVFYSLYYLFMRVGKKEKSYSH
jgi:hypothetical protein